MQREIQRLSYILEERPTFIFGRFPFIRSTYSQLQALIQRISHKDFIEIGDTYESKDKLLNFLTLTTTGSIRFHLELEEYISNFTQNSFSLGLELESSICDELVQASKSSLLRPSCSNWEQHLFYLWDIQNGKLHGQEIATGHVINSSKIPAVRKIALDVRLLEIVTVCLGYRPYSIDSWLFWSFANGLSLTERRAQNQTIDYHYDVHGLSFVYVSFYLTDVTAKTGAHVLVRGSHRDKKLKYLLGSVRLSEEEILAYYGQKKVHVIEGKSGTGFIEDTSCYHKALPPIEGNRLMLQLRYS